MHALRFQLQGILKTGSLIYTACIDFIYIKALIVATNNRVHLLRYVYLGKGEIRFVLHMSSQQRILLLVYPHKKARWHIHFPAFNQYKPYNYRQNGTTFVTPFLVYNTSGEGSFTVNEGWLLLQKYGKCWFSDILPIDNKVHPIPMYTENANASELK